MSANRVFIFINTVYIKTIDRILDEHKQQKPHYQPENWQSDVGVVGLGLFGFFGFRGSKGYMAFKGCRAYRIPSR